MIIRQTWDPHYSAAVAWLQVCPYKELCLLLNVSAKSLLWRLFMIIRHV